MSRIKFFVEKEVSCYVIDSLEEHLDLLLSVEMGIENIRNPGIPFRSEFEKFVPYVHISENFEYLDMEIIDSGCNGMSKMRSLVRENNIKREKQNLREKFQNELQKKYYDLLEKAQVIHEYGIVECSLSKTFRTVDLCLAEFFGGSALDCCRNRRFLHEFLVGSVRSQLQLRD